MESVDLVWQLDHGRIRLADLVYIYPERMPAPSDLLAIGTIPQSYGIAPVAGLRAGGTEVSLQGVALVAVADTEVVWLGFQPVARDRPISIRVRVDAPESLDALTGKLWREALPADSLVCPPAFCLPGICRGVGCEPFGWMSMPAKCDILQRLTVFAHATSAGPAEAVISDLSGLALTAELALVRPSLFAKLTGILPAPLEEESAYKGWRLP